MDGPLPVGVVTQTAEITSFQLFCVWKKSVIKNTRRQNDCDSWLLPSWGLLDVPPPGGLSLPDDAGCGPRSPEPGPPEPPSSGTRAPWSDKSYFCSGSTKLDSISDSIKRTAFFLFPLLLRNSFSPQIDFFPLEEAPTHTTLGSNLKWAKALWLLLEAQSHPPSVIRGQQGLSF